MKLSYLNLMTTDPAFNLAAEEYVFDSLPKDRMYVMLWQNDNAIIIGKHQNTLAQINQSFVEEKGIRVVRRRSGGGAVYHDLGNLNYTIITDAAADAQVDFGRFCDVVIRALARVGVLAERNGRNDMTIDGKKFSGNAQYIRAGRVMHHGTILFDSDMTVLSRALQVDEAKIRAKGVSSVRSRVTNVRPCLREDMSLQAFRQVLLESILEEYPGDPWHFSPEEIREIEKIRDARYATWAWNYGQSPACTLLRKARVEGCGTVEAYLTVEKGIIRQVEFRGDFFSAREPEELAECLASCPYEKEALWQRLSAQDIGRYFAGLEAKALMDILWE